MYTPDGTGKPTYGNDAVGETDDSYATIITVPVGSVRFNLHAAVGDGGAMLSVDGGESEGYAVPANTERYFPNVTLFPGDLVKAKNLIAGADYTDLHVSIW